MWADMPLAPTQFVTALTGYRVLAVAQRGHGKSDKPHDPKQYDREMAGAVAARQLQHLDRAMPACVMVPRVIPGTGAAYLGRAGSVPGA